METAETFYIAAKDNILKRKPALPLIPSIIINHFFNSDTEKKLPLHILLSRILFCLSRSPHSRSRLITYNTCPLHPSANHGHHTGKHTSYRN